MKNSFIAFLIGALAALLIYLKNKNPDIVQVSGDLIEEQKIKDNRKIKGKSPWSNYGVMEPGHVMISGDMSKRDVLKAWRTVKI